MKLYAKLNAKSFNSLGEVTPASTFMSGKVKVMGDLSKALKLEQVLKAAREADERRVARKA